MDLRQMHIYYQSVAGAPTSYEDHLDIFSPLFVMIQYYVSFNLVLNDRAPVDLTMPNVDVAALVSAQWCHWEVVEAAPRAKQRLGSPKNKTEEVHD